MLIRLVSIELNNFKNVQYGKIKMPSYIHKKQSEVTADIVGIYGQNGSGKTAVTDTLSFAKMLMSGTSLPINVVDYITKSTHCATAVCSFFVKDGGIDYIAEYRFTVSDREKTVLTSEKAAVWSYEDGRKRRLDSIEYNAETSEFDFLPKKRWSAAVRKKIIDVEVEKRMCMRERRSILFSPAIYDVLFADESTVLGRILSGLKDFAQKRMYIVRADTFKSGGNALDFVIPIADTAQTAKYSVCLTEPTVMPLQEYDRFSEMMNGLNTVMKVVVPGLTVQTHEFGHEIMRDGKEGVRFELMSKRNSVTVPLRYESEGIKKIISILNLITAMYNNYSMCIAIDEMDAGVFEFLLGELLSCIDESGKGQLIFTSHNLRPLEMIKNEDLVFTTTNPSNRYIRIQEKNANLRSSYLRHIMLGGLQENIYESVNSLEIAQALRKSAASGKETFENTGEVKDERSKCE